MPDLFVATEVDRLEPASDTFTSEFAKVLPSRDFAVTANKQSSIRVG